MEEVLGPPVDDHLVLDQGCFDLLVHVLYEGRGGAVGQRSGPGKLLGPALLEQVEPRLLNPHHDVIVEQVLGYHSALRWAGEDKQKWSSLSWLTNLFLELIPSHNELQVLNRLKLSLFPLHFFTLWSASHGWPNSFFPFEKYISNQKSQL